MSLWVVGGVVVILLLLILIGVIVEKRNERLYGGATLERLSSFGGETGFMAESADLSYRPSPIPPPEAGRGVAPEAKSRLIIRNGWLSVVVEDVPAAVDGIKKFVEERGGFVVSSEISGLSDNPRAMIEVRIPVKQLDAAIQFTKERSANVVSESVTGEDVTEEYVDEQAHLANLEAQEKRFREILQQANNVDEILRVQQHVDRVRDEINRTTARITYLEESAELSKLTINLAIEETALPVIAPGEKWRPKLIVKQSARVLFQLFRGIANTVIFLVIVAPVWVPIGLVIWWLIRRHMRK